MNKKKIIAVLATVAVVATLFTGCGKGTGSETKKETQSRIKTEVKIGLATDAGGKGDKSFNDSAIAGLDKIKGEYTIEPIILESKDQNAYKPNLTTIAGQCELTFGVGFMMQQAITDAAVDLPNKKFAIIDAVVNKPNVVSISFKEHEGSFLAGVIAGKSTKTGKVGFLGGADFPLIQKFEAGFIAGVKSVNPKAADDLMNRKNVKYTGKFDDTSAGKEASKALYNSGCDVIFHASGACGIGLLDVAHELRAGGKNVWAIGVDADQALTVEKDADAILTSMIKRVDTGCYQVSKSVIDNAFKGGTIVEFGLKEEGVGLAVTKNPKAPAGVYELADKYKKAIIEGKIVVPSTLADSKTFKAVEIK